MARHDYGPLHEAHQKALDDLNAHIEQSQQLSPERGADTVERGASPPTEVSSEREPTRPENHPSRSHTPGWTADQRMDKQNESANRWFAASNERLNSPEAREHRAHVDALNQHINEARNGPSPEQSPDISRKPDDIER